MSAPVNGFDGSPWIRRRTAHPAVVLLVAVGAALAPADSGLGPLRAGPEHAQAYILVRPTPVITQLSRRSATVTQRSAFARPEASATTVDESASWLSGFNGTLKDFNLDPETVLETIASQNPDIELPDEVEVPPFSFDIADFSALNIHLRIGDHELGRQVRREVSDALSDEDEASLITHYLLEAIDGSGPTLAEIPDDLRTALGEDLFGRIASAQIGRPTPDFLDGFLSGLID